MDRIPIAETTPTPCSLDDKILRFKTKQESKQISQTDSTASLQENLKTVRKEVDSRKKDLYAKDK